MFDDGLHGCQCVHLMRLYVDSVLESVHNHTAFVGEKLWLRCGEKSFRRSYRNTQWLLNGQFLPSEGDPHRKFWRGNLNVTSVTLKDAGVYTCFPPLGSKPAGLNLTFNIFVHGENGSVRSISQRRIFSRICREGQDRESDSRQQHSRTGIESREPHLQRGRRTEPASALAAQWKSGEFYENQTGSSHMYPVYLWRKINCRNFSRWLIMKQRCCIRTTV